MHPIYLVSDTSEIPNLEQKTIKEYVKCLLVQTNIETQVIYTYMQLNILYI